VSQQVVDFSKKSVKLKYFFELTFTDDHTYRQKFGTILENKMVQKKFSKNGITKNLLLNCYSSMKKNQKDSNDF
jgi:hypothetical protein